MNSRHRINAVLESLPLDRYPFVPSIYEHGARVIGGPPAQAARSAALMARGMRNFVWGCGAVAYNTAPQDLLRFKKICADAEAAQ